MRAIEPPLQVVVTQHSSLSKVANLLRVDFLNGNLQLLYAVGKLGGERLIDLRIINENSRAHCIEFPTSHTSMSSFDKPAFARTLGIASAGEMPMYRGSTPVC